MKILLAILGLINGCYMLLDGIYVMLKGKYIGPEKPGPWANLFYSLGVDVFKLGPVFLIYGVLWMVWVYGILTAQSWAFMFGLFIAFLSLWYLPVGTLIAVAVIILLFIYKR